MAFRPKRFRGNESGIAALEFAILAPLFAIAAIGTADYALRFEAQASLDDALRIAVEGAIRLGDDAQGVAEFLNQNGYSATITTFSSDDSPEATSASKTEVMQFEVQPTEACFESGVMQVGGRGETACADPEKWLRLAGSYRIDTFTAGAVDLGAQIDVKVQ